MLSTGSHWVSAYAYDAQGSRALLIWFTSSSRNTTSLCDWTSDVCSLDPAANAINGTQTIPQNGTILVQGWAAENGNPVAQVRSEERRVGKSKDSGAQRGRG